ncbi:MAG: hypothetical protein PHH04_08120 [Thomasclavelia sp.]|nr:hypothetical protein [Thomasclavelia sp.]
MKKTKVILSSAIALTMITATAMPAFALSREETVYSKLDSTGKTKSTVVSEQLKNDEKSDTIKDTTDLTDVTNSNGNEKYTKDGDTYTWNAKGKDIYYQGKTDKECPIGMNIVYKLNGVETPLKKMLGKSGDVTIEITYSNNSTKDVNGETLYTPFVVTTATMIPTKNNTNVSVSNGKVVSNGSNNIVVALAAPGLYEDYNNEDALKDLNKVTVTYNTKKFKLNSLMTVAQSKLIDSDDLKIFDQLYSVYSMMDTFTSSYSQILAGGKTLESSLATLATSYNEFNSGVNTLASGASDLDSGVNKVVTGASTLDSKTGDLTSALNDLKTGASQVNESMKTVNTNLGKLTTGASSVTAGTSAAIESTTKLKAGVDQALNGDGTASNPGITATIDGTIAKINSQVSALQLSGTISRSNYQPLTDGVKAFTDAMNSTTDIDACKLYGNTAIQLTQAETALKSLVNLEAGLKSMQTGLTASLDKDSTTSLYALKAGATQISDGLTLLTKGDGDKIKGTNYLQTDGTQVVADGAAKINDGAKQLKEGTKTLADGTKTVKSGTSSIKSGSASLASASTKIMSASLQLKTGSTSLVEGMTKFDTEGVQKINDLVNNTLKKYADKTQTLVDLANEYDSFTTKGENVTSNTKFIIVVDSKSK